MHHYCRFNQYPTLTAAEPVPATLPATIHFGDEKQSYYVLSNCWPHTNGRRTITGVSKLYYNGQHYPTATHLYYCLIYLYQDATPVEQEWHEVIRQATSPETARILGEMSLRRLSKGDRRLAGLIERYRGQVRNRLAAGDPSGEIRCNLMRVALQAKLDSCQEFRQALLETNPLQLVEDSDSEWGWRQNWMGALLEELRQSQLSTVGKSSTDAH